MNEFRFRTIKSVEDHIKESISKEASFKKSIFNNISIDVESINIQRLLDHEALKSSSFINIEVSLCKIIIISDRQYCSKFQTTTPQSEHYENTRTVDKVFTKPTTTVKSNVPTKVGLSNMPIQGSFEVTKTDADISQKKSSPTTTKTSTLRPFTISNAGMRIKTKKTTIEKVKNPTVPSTGISHVNKVTIDNSNFTDVREQDNLSIETVRPSIDTTTTESNMVTVANVTTPSETTSITEKVTPNINVNQKTTSTTESSPLLQSNFQRRTNVDNPPKLDANLFTTAPLIDDEPWLPINPISPQNNFDTVITKVVHVDAEPDNNGNAQLNILPRNKIRFSEPFDDSFNREMLFHSFTNPAFTYLTPGIETLGSANLRPYPIPVNKIVDEPDSTESVQLLSPILSGVESAENSKSNETQLPTTVESFGITGSQNLSNHTVETEPPTVSLGDVLLDLLGGKTDNNRKDYPSTTALPEATTSINFKNIKEFVLSTAKTNSSSLSSQYPQESQLTNVNVTKKLPPLSTSTLRNFAENATMSTKPTSYVEIETVQYTPVSESWNQPSLFPVQSKFEYVNGTLVSSFDTQTIRRIFNETLHAWIIENSQKDKVNENDEIFARKNSSHIQNISAIFDTLASELGIQPNISTKSPPFETVGNSKLKTSHAAGINQLGQNKTMNGALTSTTTTTTTMRTLTDFHPPIKQESMYGEAEIEEVDPTQYEQILLSNSRVTSTTVPSLVTLMPVKSNSGIRQRTPMIDKLKMSIKNSRRIA